MKKKLIIAAVLTVAVLTVVAIIYGNKALEVNKITVSSDNLPDSFSGFRIAQVSDLHNAEFGEENAELLKLLEGANPDIIAITGDLVDSRRTDIDIALKFAESAVKIAPVYYVSGNHEARISEYEKLKVGLADAGITVLENESAILERGEDSITLMGIDDPSFTTDYLLGDSKAVTSATLKSLGINSDKFTLLLAHRPELFEVYTENEIDVVLSGHAHGGQFRLPFVGGVVAPGQGLFPEYDAGLFTKDDTYMVVSRGLGNSIIPFRINNHPEIVLVELEASQEE